MGTGAPSTRPSPPASRRKARAPSGIQDLSRRFGRGFGARNLAQMRAFYIAWPGDEILQTVSAKFNPVAQTRSFPLSWSAYVRLLSVRSPEARAFYETEALRCGWTVRQLDRQIESPFFERAALSRHKATLLEKDGKPMPGGQPGDRIAPEQAIRDPFVLEFLDLKDDYSETELEEALIHHLTDFLLELGDDFAFVGRQRRLRLDDTWFRVDLLLFHRRLRCLVIIDLKVGRFSHADAGQMHVYLNYAREHWMKEGENPPVGLILCAAKGAEEAHYALEGLPNQVLAAEYQTLLPEAKRLADELERTRRTLELRRPPSGRARTDRLSRPRTPRPPKPGRTS